ncbi:MAG: hypothetical protein POH28_03435 [Acidocella sp.]|nr:hypothetical protein [Acidocella sp.]
MELGPQIMGEVVDHLIGDGGDHHGRTLGHLAQPLGLIALGFEGGEALFERDVGDVGDTVFDGGIEALDLLLCLAGGVA